MLGLVMSTSFGRWRDILTRFLFHMLWRTFWGVLLLYPSPPSLFLGLSLPTCYSWCVNGCRLATVGSHERWWKRHFPSAFQSSKNGIVCSAAPNKKAGGGELGQWWPLVVITRSCVCSGLFCKTFLTACKTNRHRCMDQRISWRGSLHLNRWQW